MENQKGSLSIHSENIFPIIKKWLYSDHDIFIRELVSNATDAITKLKKLNVLGEVELSEDETFSVQVLLDKEKSTIQFIDNGLGMTSDEVKEYINQIAFSGAESFLEKYKDKGANDQIIGHFGLGFYSSFMISSQVQIDTLSYKSDAQAVRWICDGRTEYEMSDSDRTTRGTTVTMYVNEENKDFLDGWKLKDILNKYCSFMPVPIFFTEVGKEVEASDDDTKETSPTPINDTIPLYIKSPNDCTDEEYKTFYHKTFGDFKDPLFWIHLNMDYPFNLKGILYFPKLGNEFETMEGKIKLYNSQVYVADNIKEVIPEFLLLLKGVIDCPELPLNVSRSFLQNDGFAQKISSYITKKVGDKLVSLYKSEKESFEKYWDDIHPFVKFGCLKDDKFYDKVKEIILFKTVNNVFVSLSEYLENCKDKHPNKVYYATDLTLQAQYVKMFKEHEMDALVLTSNIDQPFISFIESKNSDVHFSRIDADITDTLKSDQTEDEETQKISESKLAALFKEALAKDSLIIKTEYLKNESISALMTLDEQSRRMNEMSKMYGFMGMGGMETQESLVLNLNNKLVKFMLNHLEDDKSTALLIGQHVYDLAYMSHKPLSPEGMTQFIERNHQLLEKLI